MLYCPPRLFGNIINRDHKICKFQVDRSFSARLIFGRELQRSFFGLPLPGSIDVADGAAVKGEKRAIASSMRSR
jgi:hypothetical protein